MILKVVGELVFVFPAQVGGELLDAVIGGEQQIPDILQTLLIYVLLQGGAPPFLKQSAEVIRMITEPLGGHGHGDAPVAVDTDPFGAVLEQSRLGHVVGAGGGGLRQNQPHRQIGGVKRIGRRGARDMQQLLEQGGEPVAVGKGHVGGEPGHGRRVRDEKVHPVERDARRAALNAAVGNARAQQQQIPLFQRVGDVRLPHINGAV